jgi:hypothetical protein
MFEGAMGGRQNLSIYHRIDIGIVRDFENYNSSASISQLTYRASSAIRTGIVAIRCFPNKRP